jgi:hypothetical protein
MLRSARWTSLQVEGWQFLRGLRQMLARLLVLRGKTEWRDIGYPQRRSEVSARGAMITVLATELSNAVRADEQGEGHDIGAGMFGPAVSAWIRKTADAFMEASGTSRSDTTGEAK